MAITFPTGHDGRSSHGVPRRARPCQCKTPLIDPGQFWCSTCGKIPKDTINETFAERARTIQTRNRQRKLKAA